MLLDQRHREIQLGRENRPDILANFTISSGKQNKAKNQQYLLIARDFSYSELLDRDPVNHSLLGKF